MTKLSPKDKRKHTIIKKYGSYKNMLKNRDVRDLILGGYNGGIRKTQKGFAKWEDGKLSEYAKKRKRDSKGRFAPEEEAQGPLHPESTEEQTDR